MEMALKLPQKRKSFHIMRERGLLAEVMPELPKTGEAVKIVSSGGFSSIAFVRLVGDLAGINELTASTLAIGKKHLAVLDAMHDQGKLDRARFIVGKIMRDRTEEAEYGYFKRLEEVCRKNRWQLTVKSNHSKILLFDTPAGKYVLETSSNLNENPNMEQFSFEKDAELYDFYNKILTEILREGAS